MKCFKAMAVMLLTALVVSGNVRFGDAEDVHVEVGAKNGETGTFYASVDEEVPESIQQIYAVAALQERFPESDFLIGDFERLLAESWIEYTEDVSGDRLVSRTYVISEYMSIRVELGDWRTGKVSDRISRIYLYVEMPATVSEVPTIESIKERMLLYREDL